MEEKKAVRITAVRELLPRDAPSESDIKTFRGFTVATSGPVTFDEQGLIAAAVDPKDKTAIPATGDVHPDDDCFVAEPPNIFSIMQSRNFFNVRVIYVRKQ